MTLVGIFKELEAAEISGNYSLRNMLVIRALDLALFLGYKAGIRIDQKEPEWPVVVIELPTGQVTWHIKAHETLWDGHTTEEKWARVHAFK